MAMLPPYVCPSVCKLQVKTIFSLCSFLESSDENYWAGGGFIDGLRDLTNCVAPEGHSCQDPIHKRAGGISPWGNRALLLLTAPVSVWFVYNIYFRTKPTFGIDLCSTTWFPHWWQQY